MEKDPILSAVDAIIVNLQSKKWNEHSPASLISAQGKLASYLGNVGGKVARAEYEYNLLMINHEQYEQERYFHYRKNEGQSQQDAKASAKLDAFAKEKAVYEAKYLWHSLRSIVKTMEALSVACSTTLKHQRVDLMNSNYQGN